MNNVINWQDVLENIQAQDAAKGDALVRTEEIKVDEGRIIVPHRSVIPFKSDFKNGSPARAFGQDDGEVVLTLSDRAITQMCGRMEIPPRYLKRKMTERAWNVVDTAIRDDLDRHGQRLLLRTIGTQIRAVLSEKYVRLNDFDVVKDVVEIVQGRTEVRSGHLDIDGMWIKATFPDLKFTGPDGSDYFVGMILGNSEVGDRSVSCGPFIYRKVCTNDMVIVHDEAFEHRHIYVDRAQLRFGLKKAIAAAVREGDTFADQIQMAMAAAVEDPMDVIDQIARKARYSQKVVDTVKASYQMEPMANKWGLANAFTRAAQTLEGDRRVEMEWLGGNLIVAPDLRRMKLPAIATSESN
jgi:hypothetical protein